jgi:hypothetical protein
LEPSKQYVFEVGSGGILKGGAEAWFRYKDDKCNYLKVDMENSLIGVTRGTVECQNYKMTKSKRASSNKYNYAVNITIQDP